MSADLTSTIGHQRAANYALQPMTRAEFADEGGSVPGAISIPLPRFRDEFEILDPARGEVGPNGGGAIGGVVEGPVASGTMSHIEPSSGSTSRYQFSLPGGVEIEVRELADDEAAAAYARELSNARQDAIVIKRHDHVDWEYVTEVDETP